MPDSVSDCHRLGLAEGYGVSHGQGLRHSEADNNVTEGDHDSQADGIAERNSRSLGRTNPNRNL